MTFDNFTIKAQEAIQKAVEVASSRQSQAVDDIHLLKGLLLADEHILPFLFKKSGVDPQSVIRAVDAGIEVLPKVSGAGAPYFTPATEQIFFKAQNMLKTFGDEYVTVEILLLAMMDQNAGAARLL